MYVWSQKGRIDSFLVTNELKIECKQPLPEVFGGVTTVNHEGRIYNTVAIGTQY